MELFGYFASLFIGLLLGILGGGGSILSIPILVYLFHVDAALASAYSLFIVGTTSLAGAIPKYRGHLVNVKTGFIFGIPSIIAIFITRRWIVGAIPEIIFQTGSFAVRQAVVPAWVCYPYGAGFCFDDPWKKRTANLRGGMRIPLTIIEGLLIGFLSRPRRCWRWLF